MARRVPKPLVPVLVAVAAIGLATVAALPSFAGPNITPGSGGAEPTATTPAVPPTTTPAPAPTPTLTNPPADDDAGPAKGVEEGPRDCVNCGQPSRD